MSQAQTIRDYVAKNPNATNNQIGKALNMPTKTVASQTTQMIQRGTMVREVVDVLPSNVKVYGYSLSSSKDIVVSAKENVLSVPKKRQQSSGLDTLVDQVAAQIAKVLGNKIKSRLLIELEDLTPKIEPEVNVQEVLQQVALPKPQDKAPKLMKVGIVGLLPQNAGLIHTEFADRFDLKFWDTGNNASLKSLGISCEFVLCTKWCGHKQVETLKSVGANTRFIPGGMEQLRETLINLYLEEKV